MADTAHLDAVLECDSEGAGLIVVLQDSSLAGE
jgi:hypothetical protein